jgi:uncharacterized protein (TIGR02001 family)
VCHSLSLDWTTYGYGTSRMCAWKTRRTRRWFPALTALLFGRAVIAQAAGFGGFIALTGDYVYRGATQTGHDPAFQADAHYYSPGGWLAGLWGTSVRPDPGETTSAELDPYLGYTRTVGDEWSMRLAAVYHAYPGDASRSRYRYSELAGTMAYQSQVFITLAVPPDTEVQTAYGGTWAPHTLPSFQFMKADRIRLHQYIRTFAAACAAVPDGFC